MTSCHVVTSARVVGPDECVTGIRRALRDGPNAPRLFNFKKKNPTEMPNFLFWETSSAIVSQSGTRPELENVVSGPVRVASVRLQSDKRTFVFFGAHAVDGPGRSTAGTQAGELPSCHSTMVSRRPRVAR